MLQTIKTLLIFLACCAGIMNSQCWAICSWHSIEDCSAVCTSNTAKSGRKVQVCENICQAWADLNKGEIPPSCDKIKEIVRDSCSHNTDQCKYGFTEMMFKIYQLGCCT